MTIPEEKQTGKNKPPPIESPTKLPKCNCLSPRDDEKFSPVAAHKEAIATIKYAVKNFVCNIIASTQETITKITNESNRHLQNLKKTASEMIPKRRERAKCACPAVPKEISNISSDQDSNEFGVFNVDTSYIEDLPYQKQSRTDTNASKSFFLQNVDSSLIQLVSNALCYSIQPRSFNEQSSIYDVPIPQECSWSCSEELEDIPCDPEDDIHLFSSMEDDEWDIAEDDEINIATRWPSSTNVGSVNDDYFMVNINI